MYELHFDFSYSLWLLIPFAVGLGFFFYFKWGPKQNPGIDEKGAKGHKAFVFGKWLGWIVGVFCFAFFILSVVSHTLDYREKRGILESGQFSTADGCVEQFHAAQFGGRDTEHFEIDGVYFEYSPSEINNGYHLPAIRGGIIKENGQHLKIDYITDSLGQNIILRIEEVKEINMPPEH